MMRHEWSSLSSRVSRRSHPPFDPPLYNMFLKVGDRERALPQIERAFVARPTHGLMTGGFLFDCNRILQQLGELERAATLRAEFLAAIHKEPAALGPLAPQWISE